MATTRETRRRSSRSSGKKSSPRSGSSRRRVQPKTAPGARGAMTRKVGPAPVWLWALLAAGLLYWVRNRQAAAGAPGTGPQGAAYSPHVPIDTGGAPLITGGAGSTGPPVIVLPPGGDNPHHPGHHRHRHRKPPKHHRHPRPRGGNRQTGGVAPGGGEIRNPRGKPPKGGRPPKRHGSHGQHPHQSAHPGKGKSNPRARRHR